MEGNIQVAVLRANVDMIEKEKIYTDRAALGTLLLSPGGVVGAKEVQEALKSQFNITVPTKNIREHDPEEFFIEFSCSDDRNLVTGRGFLEGPSFLVAIKNWTRDACTVKTEWDKRVSIKISGIPAHSYNLETLKTLLSAHCDIYSWLHNQTDLKDQRVCAWTSHAGAIPAKKWLLIPNSGFENVVSQPVTVPREFSGYLITLESTLVEDDDDIGDEDDFFFHVFRNPSASTDSSDEQ